MKRLLVLAAMFATGCDEAEVEWSAEPGVEVCERIVGECEDLCSESKEAGRSTCSDEQYNACDFRIYQESGIIELLPGLHGELTQNVVLGRRRDCEDGLGLYDAWRYE